MGKIRNFTLVGDALQVVAFVDCDGKPAYYVDFAPGAVSAEEPLSYELMADLVKRIAADVTGWEMLGMYDGAFQSRAISNFEKDWSTKQGEYDGLSV